jgi:hypothetical protein
MVVIEWKTEVFSSPSRAHLAVTPFSPVFLFTEQKVLQPGFFLLYFKNSTPKDARHVPLHTHPRVT